MSIQNRTHDMHELYVARLPINAIAGDHVPAGVPVMALTTFANSNRRFDLQADGLPVLAHSRIDQIGVCLM